MACLAQNGVTIKQLMAKIHSTRIANLHARRQERSEAQVEDE